MLLASEEYNIAPSLGSGEIVDGIRTRESSLFSIAEELGSTKAIFFGHDHRNNAHIESRGIRLCYATKTGINVYFRRGNIGGLVIELDFDRNYFIERIFI